ncbi:MAG: VOC family protein [Dehalococcoidales bacterium]|nr:VOC family protein [Dehalococcoidales bacterium]
MPQYFFDHIHLMSSDPVKTAEFYAQNFGAKLVSSRDFGGGRVTVNVNLGGVTLLIGKSRDESQNGLAHFGIRTDKLDEAVTELKSKGVPFTREITPLSPTFRISFFEAPEKVSVELQEGGM